MRTLRTAVLLALSCCMAILAGACGSDDDAGIAADGDAAQAPGRGRDASIARDGSSPEERDGGHDEPTLPDAAVDEGDDREPDAAADGSSGDADAGASEPDAAVPGNDVTPEAACEQLVTATCDWFLACRAPGGDCNAAGPTRFVAARCATTPAAVLDGRATFDPQALGPCLEEVQHATDPCSGAPPPTIRALSFSPTFQTACDDVFVGQGKIGDPCYPAGAFGNDGCGEGYCVGSACPGVCMAFLAPGATCDSGRCARDAFCNGVCRRYLLQDEDCTDPLDRCATGLYCAQDHSCKPVVALGQPCTGADECGGYACAPEGEGGALVCFARVPEAAPCHGDVSCASELICIESQCVRQVATGQHCYRDANCPAADRCTRASIDDVLGSCEPRLGVGGPCTDLGDYDCQAGLYCDYSGTPSCAPRVGESQSCAQARCLETLWCDPDGQQCRAYSAEGGTCHREGPLGCMPGLLCMGDGQCHMQGTQPGHPCSGALTQSCAAGLSCDRASQTCVTLPGVDQPCNQGEEPSCASGSWCACDGLPCDGNFDPWTGSALERCLPQVALGESCVGWQQCAQGDCNASGMCSNPLPPCTGP